MKVFVFKSTNEHAGSFTIERMEALGEAFAQFAASKPVKAFDYLESSGRVWTVVNGGAGLELQEGRAYPPRPNEMVAMSPGELRAALLNRYQSAFTAAHRVVNIGKLIKGMGAILGVGILLAGLIIGSEIYNTALFLFICFVIGCGLGISIWVLGILVSAQGQTQFAVLDTAVNSSRHLSDSEIAQLLTQKWHP